MEHMTKVCDFGRQASESLQGALREKKCWFLTLGGTTWSSNKNYLDRCCGACEVHTAKPLQKQLLAHCVEGLLPRLSPWVRSPVPTRWKEMAAAPNHPLTNPLPTTQRRGRRKRRESEMSVKKKVNESRQTSTFDLDQRSVIYSSLIHSSTIYLFRLLSDSEISHGGCIERKNNFWFLFSDGGYGLTWDRQNLGS